MEKVSTCPVNQPTPTPIHPAANIPASIARLPLLSAANATAAITQLLTARASEDAQSKELVNAFASGKAMSEELEAFPIQIDVLAPITKAAATGHTNDNRDNLWKILDQVETLQRVVLQLLRDEEGRERGLKRKHDALQVADQVSVSSLGHVHDGIIASKFGELVDVDLSLKRTAHHSPPSASIEEAEIDPAGPDTVQPEEPGQTTSCQSQEPSKDKVQDGFTPEMLEEAADEQNEKPTGELEFPPAILATPPSTPADRVTAESPSIHQDKRKNFNLRILENAQLRENGTTPKSCNKVSDEPVPRANTPASICSVRAGNTKSLCKPESYVFPTQAVNRSADSNNIHKDKRQRTAAAHVARTLSEILPSCPKKPSNDITNNLDFEVLEWCLNMACSEQVCSNFKRANSDIGKTPKSQPKKYRSRRDKINGHSLNRDQTKTSVSVAKVGDGSQIDKLATGRQVQNHQVLAFIKELDLPPPRLNIASDHYKRGCCQYSTVSSQQLMSDVIAEYGLLPKSDGMIEKYRKDDNAKFSRTFLRDELQHDLRTEPSFVDNFRSRIVIDRSDSTITHPVDQFWALKNDSNPELPPYPGFPVGIIIHHGDLIVEKGNITPLFVNQAPYEHWQYFGNYEVVKDMYLSQKEQDELPVQVRGYWSRGSDSRFPTRLTRKIIKFHSYGYGTCMPDNDSAITYQCTVNLNMPC